MINVENDSITYTTKVYKIDKLQMDLMLTSEWQQYRNVYDQAVQGKEFDYPIHVEIENIYACNLRCVHCARQYIDPIGTHLMSHALFKKIIQEAVAIGTRAIGLAIWGEVFLDKDIFERIAYAKDKGIIDIRLHSNGHLITDTIAKQIIDSGVTFLSISLDALTGSTYAQMRGGNYDNAIRGFANIVSQKIQQFSLLPKLRVSFVKSSINEHEADYFAKYFSEYCDVAIQQFWDPWNILPKHLVPKDRAYVLKKQCFDNFFKIFIRYDGTVVPCC